MNKPTVWAFNQVDDENSKKLIYESINNDRKSRFGWSSENKHNLKLKDNWSENHPRQQFLLDIKKNDWIVHINTPEWGKCIAGQVISEYDFDEGLEFNSEGNSDFRHNFSLDPDTIIEFSRTDPNVFPSVNLTPRYRFQRIYAVDEFLRSIENLKNKNITLRTNESRELYYMRQKTEKSLEKITKDIQEMNKSKKLEGFLADVIRKIPGVEKVVENGYGWKTDHGADLIVTIESRIGNLQFDNKIIVQIKSYEGNHYDLSAVEQVKNGIKHYDGVAGMIITTAEKTKELEEEIIKVQGEIEKPIDLLCGKEVARFVVKHAPDLLFNL